MRNVATRLKELDGAFLKWCYVRLKKAGMRPDDKTLLLLFQAENHGHKRALDELDEMEAKVLGKPTRL